MIFCRLLVPTFVGNYFADFVTHFAVSTIASIVPYFADCSEYELFLKIRMPCDGSRKPQKPFRFIIPVAVVCCQHYVKCLLIRAHSDYFTIFMLPRVLYFVHLLLREVKFIWKICNKWAALSDLPAPPKVAKVVMLSKTGCSLPVNCLTKPHWRYSVFNFEKSKVLETSSVVSRDDMCNWQLVKVSRTHCARCQ